MPGTCIKCWTEWHISVIPGLLWGEIEDIAGKLV